tara:strand:- start:340 stop:1194 length:855 start_codon:yes stop_codon:yes gene_type:complete
MTNEKNILQTFVDNQFESKILTNQESGLENLSNAIMEQSPDLEIVNLERYLKNPSSIKENRSFDDLRGFVEYVSDYKADTTVIFAGRESIEAIFDYHQKDSPKWSTHRASYAIRASARWAIWLRAHNVWMDQKQFAEFLDTGLNEIIDPEQADILHLVKNFRATVSQEVESEESEGGTSFNYRKITKAGNSKTESLTIPDSLTIKLQPFDNLDVINSKITDEKLKIPAYQFKAKINWRIEGESADSQSIQFKIQILNVEQAIDATLEIVRSAISHVTDVKTYIG